MNVVMGGQGNRIGLESITEKHEQNAIVAGLSNQICNTGIALRGAVTLGGRQNEARLLGQVVHGYGINALGLSQSSMLVMARTTTDATVTEMSLDSATAAAGNRIVLEDQAAYFFEIQVIARRTDADGEGAAYRLTGAIDRNTGVATTALLGTVTKEVIHEDNASWDVAVTADTTNGSLKVEVTGEAAKSVRWSAFVRLTQVKG